MLTRRITVPAARTIDLVTTESGDEVLVYDSRSHHIHHLNQTSAVIWRLCDGQRSLQDLRRMAAIKLGAPVGEDVVALALGKLADAGLLDVSQGVAPFGQVQSRRTLLRRAAVAGAIAVPAVISMTAPTSAASAFCNQSCRNNAGCGGGTTCAKCIDTSSGAQCSGQSVACTCQ